jgi:cation diffusion facilitator CzcD-associated flavoprotein CzcO
VLYVSSNIWPQIKAWWTILTVIQFAESEMKRKLASKPEIAEAIIPKDFAVGCRRPTPGNGYLEALCEDNVEVVLEGIAEITPSGIRTVDGKEHHVDVIVCATGFDVSWKPAYPTIGRGNKSLSEEWKDIPSTYLSITVPHFPNYLSKSNQPLPRQAIEH